MSIILRLLNIQILESLEIKLADPLVWNEYPRHMVLTAQRCKVTSTSTQITILSTSALFFERFFYWGRSWNHPANSEHLTWMAAITSASTAQAMANFILALQWRPSSVVSGSSSYHAPFESLLVVTQLQRLDVFIHNYLRKSQGILRLHNVVGYLW